MPTIKSRHSNISYSKSNLSPEVEQFYTAHNPMGFNILIPQCFSLDINKTSKISKSFFRMYPSLEANLEMFLSDSRNFGKTQFVTIDNKNNKNLNKIVFANMVCNKTTGYRKLDYIMLAKCLYQIRGTIDANWNNPEKDKTVIYCTKFATSSIGGNWSFVEQLMQDAWPKNNIIVYRNLNE